MTDIMKLLDQLADLQARHVVIAAEFQTLRDGILTPEIKAALEDIDAEETQALGLLREGENALTAQIKTAVIEAGVTVKGAQLQAVYSKGRESVDMKSFRGYVVAHPEAATLIQTGAPSVSIRGVK